MTTLFISDLHLQAQQPRITELFLQFLQKTAVNAEALYILGDFFEVWIGDDEVNSLHQQVIQALHYLTIEKCVPIYLMPGNRDFLIGKDFCKASGCQLLPDPICVNLYGNSVLLMHGDTLCTLDKKYQIYRRVVRSKLIQIFFLSLPLKYRQKIADNLRIKSQQHTRTTASYVMDVDQKEVELMMQQYLADYLIHGHTHRPAIHQFMLNGTNATRAVLGAWHEQGSVLICKPSANKGLTLKLEILPLT